MKKKVDKEKNKVKKASLFKKYEVILIGLIVAAIYYWAINGSNVSLFTFIRGIPYMLDFIGRMFPPNLDIIPILIPRVAETLQIAIMGTTFGVILAFPLSFLAARNVINNKILNQFVKGIFDLCRGINEIIWALLFVSMVGLGPFPGVLALTVHLTGALGRYFSEAIETVNPEIITSILSTGAGKRKTIIRGIFPQVKPLFANYVLYYFEHSIRAATILGLVGAGGIGMELITSVKLFKNTEVLTILIVMVVMIIAIDRISAYIRQKLVKVEVIE